MTPQVIVTTVFGSGAEQLGATLTSFLANPGVELQWYRVNSLDGVYLYHNNYCLREVFEAMANSPPGPRPRLPALPEDRHPLSGGTLFWRRMLHRWRHT
jgi:hypothetical protein